MNRTIIFQFDKIITIFPPAEIKNEFDACYGTLPRAYFVPGALKRILELRGRGAKLALHAAGDERIIKEALWKLRACKYFEEIVIEGEGDGCGPDKGNR